MWYSILVVVIFVLLVIGSSLEDKVKALVQKNLQLEKENSELKGVLSVLSIKRQEIVNGNIEKLLAHDPLLEEFEELEE